MRVEGDKRHGAGEPARGVLPGTVPLALVNGERVVCWSIDGEAQAKGGVKRRRAWDVGKAQRRTGSCSAMQRHVVSCTGMVTACRVMHRHAWSCGERL